MSIDTKVLRALCPLEWQGKGRHDIYGTEGCEFAQFGDLEHSAGPAGFEVYTDREDWFSTFWHGNRGHQLGRFASQGDAKKAAQAHADKLVASFAPALLDAADRLAALEAELASAREAERVQRERAERERDRAYLYRNAVPESADYVDALDHIMRTARRSRTQSRRLRWIEARARCALEGGEDWKDLDLPRFSESNQRYLQARIAELEEALAAGGDR